MTPDRGGPWPAVILYMDAGGIRPAMVDMAQRLAGAGYVVLLPDLFYRYGPYGPFVPREVFAGDFRAVLGPLMATTGNDKAAGDTHAFLGYLDTRDDVAGRRIGAVGFCMGGGMAFGGGGNLSRPVRGRGELSRRAISRPTRRRARTCSRRSWRRRSTSRRPRPTAATRPRWPSGWRSP